MRAFTVLRRQHGLHHHHEAPPVVGLGRHLEIEIGVHDHLRKRVVELVDLFVVGVVDGEPDSVQIDGLGKGPAAEAQSPPPGCVGRHLGQFDGGFQFRRRGEVESQRNVLRDVASPCRSCGAGRYRGRPCRGRCARLRCWPAPGSSRREHACAVGALSSSPSS